MILVGKRFALVLFLLTVSISAQGEKEHARLEIGQASSYPNKQAGQGLVVAADVYETGEKVKAAFGKVNPYDNGVLPILLVIENTSNRAIDLNRMKVEYVVPQHGSVSPTAPGDLAYLRGARKPRIEAVPLPVPGLPQTSRGKKSPLAEWEIQGRAFVARILPPHETASGFFYFQTGHRSNATLYISGIEEAGTAKELLYFEVPLAPVQ